MEQEAQSARSPAAERSPEPDFEREVHFAQGGWPIGAPMGGRGPHGASGNLAGMVIGYGVVGAVVGGFLLSRMVANRLGVPTATLMVFWGVVLAGAAAAMMPRLVRWFKGRQFYKGLEIKSDERYRVRCIASPEGAKRLKALGPIQSEPFEPQEFWGLLVLPPRPEMVAVWVIVSVASAGVLLALVSGGTLKGLGGAGAWSWMLFYVSFAAGGLAVAALWPTKIRVVPGRVDVLRALVFTPWKPEVRRISMRTSGVVVDLKHWRTIVEGPSAETCLSLWMWPVRGRMEMAHAILMGAVSEYKAVEVPGWGEEADRQGVA